MNMNMKLKLKYILPLLLLMLIALCISCAEKPDPAHALIGEDGTTSYVIIRSDETEQALDAVQHLSGVLKEKTGTKFKIGTDFVREGTKFVENECEILVGPTVREASGAAAAELPRSRDWGIFRTGSKVVIYGTDAIDDAVGYFIDHYLIDGNVYIADGERYLHLADYPLDRMTIAGKDIAAYRIGYTNALSNLEMHAKSLQRYIRDRIGYVLDVGIISESRADHCILLVREEDPASALDITISTEGTNIIVRTGALCDPADSVQALIGCIEAAKSDKEVSIDMLDVHTKSDPDHLQIADKTYLAALDEKAAQMKTAVLSTASEWKAGNNGRVYYFSADGNDANSGLSEDQPKKSLAALANLPLTAGDVVLFRRGDMFRGAITARSGVTYSAYGEGAKPIINNSDRDWADPSLWVKTGHDNVWKLTEKLDNVGILVFNRTWEIGNYKEITGKMSIKGKNGFEGPAQLAEELAFYSDLDTQELFLYCSVGNPGEVFDSIEIGAHGNAIAVSTASDVTVDNLHITLTGSHGVGAASCRGLTVRNCLFDWLGGSILKGHAGGNVTRYGNAVEVYGGAKQYTVYNNWIYQIYDTGITHQYSSTPSNPSNIHDGVEYYDNLIEYCFWSIEYYNTMVPGTVRETKNVYIHDNFCRFGGEGWGCPGRESGAPMLALNFSGELCENFVVENNLFDRCTGYLMRYTGKDVVFRGNTFVQYFGEKLAYLSGTVSPFDGSAASVLSSIGDTSAKLAYIMEPRG